MNIENICDNSFRNFHAKGMDYLCLKRTPELTIKAYFFGDNLTEVPEIVMPHDHRYSFRTYCINGEIVDRRFKVARRGESPQGRPVGRFDQFDYMTPLNGGDGFTWVKEAHLFEIDGRRVYKGFSIASHSSHIHTLQICQVGTVIILHQLADEVPLNKPTVAFRPIGSREPPNLSGLYDRMDPNHALKLIDQLKALGVSLDV